MKKKRKTKFWVNKEDEEKKGRRRRNFKKIN